MIVSVNEVLCLMHNLESDKSAGLDECLKYADAILSVLLSFCFTCVQVTTTSFSGEVILYYLSNIIYTRSIVLIAMYNYIV